MSTYEAGFWNRIVSGLWKADRVFNRIENAVVDGMPDGYYTIDGVSGWMELKCPGEHVRATTALFSGNHKVSIAQRNWLLAHRQAGGRGFVAIETENWVMLIGARYESTINTMTLDALLTIADFKAQRPLQDLDWLQFKNTLTKKGYTP